MQFNLTATPNTVFGAGRFEALPGIISRFGNKVLLVTGKSSFMISDMAIGFFMQIDSLKLQHRLVQINGEPSPDQIDRAVELFREWNPDVVVAIGGGSVVDAGKAISAMLHEKGSVVDFLEDVGHLKPSGKKTPLIAVPTTSGTGSEATKNAVITQLGKDGFKKSLRHDRYIPDIALVDPLLTVACPPTVTAASGMDAFTQLLESYLSTNSNPVTDALALDGMEKLMNSIEKAVFDGTNVEARTNLSYAALMSGITLANAGLGLVHGFAQPLGSLFTVPHGVVCGTLMGAVNRVTVQQLRKNGDHRTLDKYHKVAMLFGSKGNREECTDRLIDYLDELTIKFQLPKLSDFGITENDFPLIIQHTGMKYHPVQLSNEELMLVLSMRC
jgi:alcohol dehydrogenase class IV